MQTLPSVHSLIHDVPQLEVAPPSRPLISTTTFNTQPFNPGRSMPYLTGHAQKPQLFHSSYRGFAHNSIESLPSTAVSSPRTVYSDCSSSSYEFSTYAALGHLSSMSTTDSTIRPSRSKRGSESQNSFYERDSKRACSSETSDDSELDTSACSKKCKAAGSRCANPGDCKRKADKSKNEKYSRKDQSGAYQRMEDSLELCIDWRAPKQQQPNNRRVSGCDGDKQQIIEAYTIFAEKAYRDLLRVNPQAAGGIRKELLAEIEKHLADKDKKVPRVSLMAARTPTGERPCPGVLQDEQRCTLHNDYIQCRKYTRGLEFRKNISGLLR